MNHENESHLLIEDELTLNWSYLYNYPFDTNKYNCEDTTIFIFN